MKRETTMAFLAGVAVTGAFFAGMGMKESSAKPKIMNSGVTAYGNEWIMFESGETWAWYETTPKGSPEGTEPTFRWWRTAQVFDRWQLAK